MHDDRFEIIRDERGRECVRFVTRSGVTAIVDTSISMAALDKLICKLERKLSPSPRIGDCRSIASGPEQLQATP